MNRELAACARASLGLLTNSAILVVKPVKFSIPDAVSPLHPSKSTNNFGRKWRSISTTGIPRTRTSSQSSPIPIPSGWTYAVLHHITTASQLTSDFPVPPFPESLPRDRLLPVPPKPRTQPPIRSLKHSRSWSLTRHARRHGSLHPAPRCRSSNSRTARPPFSFRFRQQRQ